MTSRVEIEAALEAVLFVASEPLSRTRLLELFPEREREEAAEALAAVLERYAEAEGRGIMAEEVAGGLRLVTRPELHTWLRRFFEASGRNRLSPAALETLAIVAYRQPVTGPEIQELRGVQSTGVLKTLLERRLVRITGRRPVVGKPFVYATTKEFLAHFGLRALDELPPLEEFEEAFGPDAEAPGDADSSLDPNEPNESNESNEPNGDDAGAPADADENPETVTEAPEEEDGRVGAAVAEAGEKA